MNLRELEYAVKGKMGGEGGGGMGVASGEGVLLPSGRGFLVAGAKLFLRFSGAAHLR